MVIHLTVEAIIESCLFTSLVKSQSVSDYFIDFKFCCEGLRAETKCYQRVFLTKRAVYLRVYITGRCKLDCSVCLLRRLSIFLSRSAHDRLTFSVTVDSRSTTNDGK